MHFMDALFLYIKGLQIPLPYLIPVVIKEGS